MHAFGNSSGQIDQLRKNGSKLTHEQEENNVARIYLQLPLQIVSIEAILDSETTTTKKQILNR